MVHVIDGGGSILHPDDEQLYHSDDGDLCFLPIGEDCAKRIGTQWTIILERCDENA